MWELVISASHVLVSAWQTDAHGEAASAAALALCRDGCPPGALTTSSFIHTKITREKKVNGLEGG